MAKIGNTSFSENACKDWTFAKFKEVYSGLIKGVSLEEAFKAAGGTMPKKKKKVDSATD